MIKKNIRRYLGIIILICGIIFSATCVYATQSRTENFDKTYSLGTNQADNLINVAQKQLGKSKSNLGYTEAWCADFACDCAKLTGMSEAIIPYNYGSRGACTSLYNYMVKNCSAKVVSSREKGNLVFYYCSGCNRYVHVGIVIDDTYSIEGNYDGKVTKVKNSYTDSAGHTLASGKITRKYLRPNYSNSTPDPTINNPYGYLDSCSGGEGVINISGWAKDDDDPNAGIEIHVYVGGPAGAAGVDGISGIYANQYRSDVGNHAYSAKLKTRKTGTQKIYIYGINTGSGNNTLIATGTVTITANENPKISNIRVENLSSSGYTVRCNVSDNSGIAKVKFPTWTITNGQDDLKWYEGTVSGNTAECRIDIKNHNNETNCFYVTHIYVDDTVGNSTFGTVGETYVDSIPPVISNVKIENISTEGFDVLCKVVDNHSINRVKFPTWTRNNWQDDLLGDWPSNSLYDGKINGNIVTYHVNTSDHNNETGVYTVHIYAYDDCQNLTVIGLDINVGETESSIKPVSITTYRGHTYMLFERTSSEGDSTDKMGWSKVAAYCQSLGGTLACITSAEENAVVASMVSAYGKPCWIGGNALENNGTFVWETGEEFSYTNWDVGEPNNKNGNQIFIRMYPSGFWDDCEAMSDYAFICEFGEPILSVAKCTITLSENSFVYDTNPKTPSISVKYKNTILTEGVDYAISYSNNVNAGIAEIKITGKGSYTGTATRNFKIEKAEQEISVENSTERVKEQDSIKVKAAGQGELSYISMDADILEVNKDGIVTGKKAGTGIIRITANGNDNYKSANIDLNVIVEHIYKDLVLKKATCTEEGQSAVVCTVCGTTKENSIKVIPKSKHVWDTDYTIDKYSTCIEKGEKSLHCIVCDAINENSVETIPLIEHTWNAGKVIQEATCNASGTKTYTCTICQTTRTEEIPATGKHQNTEVKNQKEATCTEEGYTGDTYCKDCGTKLSSGKTIAKTGHKWDAGKVTQEATCTEKGIKTYTCLTCGSIRTEELPSTGHQNTEVRNNREATCMKEGYTGDTYCKDCGTKLSSGKVISKTEHQWDNGKTTQEATCTSKGIKTYTCAICESTRIEELPSTGHRNTVLRNAKEATCIEEGYTGDIYCKDCGVRISAGQKISKTAHNWDNGKTTQEATCTSGGVKTYTCTNCQATRTEEIPATGHGTQITKFAKKASCKSEGYTGDIYCQTCGEMLKEGDVLPKTEHSWDSGRVTKQPTVTATGVMTYTCRNCKTTKTSAIAKLKPTKLTPGKTVRDNASNGIYKVLKDGVTVEFTKPITKRTTVKIPDTVKISGITCKVTGIASNAFKNNTTLKTITIGKNVATIGTNAFYGCKNLVKVAGGNGIVKISNKAFGNCINLTGITIPKKVRSIGIQAFYNCKKLKTIIIKTSTLTTGNVGAKAFAGTHPKPTVKVPAKQIKIYGKLLKTKGMSTKAIYKQ